MMFLLPQMWTRILSNGSLERKEDYVDLVSTNINNVIYVLDTIKPDNVLQSDIDNLVNGFSSVLPVLDAAKDTFGIYKRRNVDGNKLSNTHKTWFSKSCENKRKKFDKAIAKYNKNKNYNTRRNMKIYAKEYKRTMQECYRKTVLQTSKSDSRKFWNILNIVSLKLIQKLFQLKISIIFLKPQILLMKLMNAERMKM